AGSPQPKPNYGEKPSLYKTELEVEAELEHGAKSEEGEAKSGTGYNKPRPEGETKPEYGEKQGVYMPKLEVEVEAKVEYGSTSKHSQYDANPSTDYKPKPQGEAKPIPDYKPKPEGEVKPVYGSKLEGEAKPYYDANPSTNYKPNYEAKKYTYKSKLEEEEGKAKYERKPNVVLTKPEEEKPEEKEQLLPIGVEGIVLCKSGSNYYPIAGASAKVKCVAVDEVGLEKNVPICSVVTDAKGYFFTTISALNLKDCEAFLEKSPLESCNVPTDVNKGISGAPFSGYRVLNQKHTKLYSLGPFFFTSEPKSVPNGY
ncbi:hypothetical protein Goarm_005753, partial [Gossypium armourianum]|nr:hypothetical protein [Gossypium armourianum]